MSGMSNLYTDLEQIAIDFGLTPTEEVIDALLQAYQIGWADGTRNLSDLYAKVKP